MTAAAAPTGTLQTALDHARRFQRQGWQVHVADSIPCRLSGWSSAVAATHALRPPRLDARGFVTDLNRIVSDERISSKGGAHPQPAFAIAFKDAAYGFATLQAGNKQLAFMQGIQDKNIQIKGNPALVIWFQGLMKYLKPRKRKA